jgi:ABC-type multidrug transport system fused ATPase/permease subunit
MAGERGVMLSGGQRQRLTLARSLIAGAPILVLDDAYSAIDTDTERRIRSRLAETKRCTTIIIAHRLATVRDADVILVLSNGSIIQRGTHSQLIEQPGLYRRLWDLQCESETVTESAIQTAVHMT